jgi:hypothetical protein
LKKFRFKRDFGGKLPKGTVFFPFIQELPLAILETGDSPAIRGARAFRISSFAEKPGSGSD